MDEPIPNQKPKLVDPISRCKDCGVIYNWMQDQYYVLELCSDCLSATPKNDCAGDRGLGGKKDYRTSLRINGQEGSDYFG